MRNPAAITNGILMIALLTGGAGMSAYVFVTPELRSVVTRQLPPYQYVDGKLAAAIEATYEDELPIRNPSSTALNALTYALFGEGRKGVVVGSAGWLFSAEEYDWTPRSTELLATNLAYIEQVAAELSDRGISLEIALLPEKSDIYAGHLQRPRPAAHEGKYDAVRQRLVATGAAVPDLRETLRTASLTSAVFVPTDTHWSVAGAGAVAAELADAFPFRSDIPAASFQLKPEATVQHEGDLKRFIELGAFRAMLPATDDQVTPIVATALGGSVDDFLGDDPATGAPLIALVGTSYSANQLWSFEPQLKAALGADVVNYAQEGHGPIVPMRSFMEKLDAGSIEVKAVIWEIPIRYLDDDSAADTGPDSSSV